MGIRIYAEARLPTRFGDFQIVAFVNSIDDQEHVALVRGEVRGKEDVLTRIQSECLTGDVLGSLKCDCRDQLEQAMKEVGELNTGIILYLRQEGRGIGLKEKIKAYALQDQGMDTAEANHKLGYEDDLRDYCAASGMIRALGVRSVRLMTNNPLKVKGLEAHGTVVSERVPLAIHPNRHNQGYLETKRVKMGHMLDSED